MDRGTKGTAGQRESFDAAERRAGAGTPAVPVAEGREELCVRHTGRKEAAGGSLRREKPAGDLSLHAGSGLGGGVPELFADHGPNGSDGDPPGTARRAARSGIARAARKDRGVQKAHGVEAAVGFVVWKRLQF